MKKKPATLPRGYRTCTASLAVADVAAALQFYENAFAAKIQHLDEDEPGFATIKVGNSMLFVTAGWGLHGPAVPGAVAPVGHHMYVEDVDVALSAALESGARLLSGTQNTYWGERCATIADPFGHVWTLATRVENLKPEDIRARRLEQLRTTQNSEGATAETEETDAEAEIA